MTVNVQCIVISLHEERRRLIEQQFKELIPFPVHYLKASTPDTIPDYFPATVPLVTKSRISGGHSHLRAMQYAGLDSSPELSVIFEDDVALHKTSFVSAVKELATNWSTVNSKVVSLGWVPVFPLDHYIGGRTIYSFDCSPSHRLMDDKDVVGAQAYMIHKADAKSASTLFLKNTYTEFLHTAAEALKSKESEFMDIDFFIPRYFQSVYTFPPLVIEQPLPSTIGNTNENYWFKFFKGREHMRNDYWKATSHL